MAGDDEKERGRRKVRGEPETTPERDRERREFDRGESEPREHERELTEPTETAPVTPPEREQQFEPRIWSVLAHLAIFVLPVIGPLLIMALQEQILGAKSAFVDHHAKQATVWQVAALIIGLVTFAIGGLVMAVFSVLAALAANRSEWYEYPFVGRRVAEAV